MASLSKPQTEAHNDPHLPSVVWLPPEEARRHFDKMAREKVGMGGDEFIRRLDAGEFLDLPDDFEHSAYAELAILSSFGR
jgi:hypothetical protein